MVARFNQCSNVRFEASILGLWLTCDDQLRSLECDAPLQPLDNQSSQYQSFLMMLKLGMVGS